MRDTVLASIVQYIWLIFWTDIYRSQKLLFFGLHEFFKIPNLISFTQIHKKNILLNLFLILSDILLRDNLKWIKSPATSSSERPAVKDQINNQWCNPLRKGLFRSLPISLIINIKTKKKQSGDKIGCFLESSFAFIYIICRWFLFLFLIRVVGDLAWI